MYGKSKQEKAFQREYDQAVARVNELEAILGLGLSKWPKGASEQGIADAKRFIRQLQPLAASRLDPDDPETQLDPFTLGEFDNRQVNRSPFFSR